MQLFVFEFAHQLEYIKDHLRNDGRVWSVNAATQAIARSEKLPLVNIKGLYDHDEFYQAYPLIYSKLTRIANELQGIIENVVDGLDFPIMRYSLYNYKMVYDQLYWYTFVLNKIYMQYRFNEVHCAGMGPMKRNSSMSLFEITSEGMFLSRSSSLLSYIINAIFSGLSTIYSIPTLEHVKDPVAYPSICKKYLWRILRLPSIASKVLYEVCQLILPKRLLVLGVESNEISCVKDQIDGVVNLFKIPYLVKLFLMRGGGSTHLGVIHKVDSEYHDSDCLLECFNINGFDASEIFFGLFIHTVSIARRVVISYKVVDSILKWRRPRKIIFSSLAFLGLNSLIHRWATLHHVDAYIWMHGGYGGYTSLPGYDITDYRLESNHIHYGELSKLSVLSHQSILKSLNMPPHHVIEMGSPYLQKLSSRSHRPRYAKLDGSNKRIVLVLSCYYDHNRYYMGLDSPYEALNYIDELSDMLQVLSKYENDYTIDVLDYPSKGFSCVIKHLFKYHNISNINYVAGVFYPSYISSFDLVIHYCSTTSLVQTLLAGRNVYLFDPAKKITQSLHAFTSLSFYSSDSVEFLFALNESLHCGLCRIKGNDKSSLQSWLRTFDIDDFRNKVIC